MDGDGGNDTYIEVPGSSDVIVDSGGIDTIDFSGALSAIHVDLALSSGEVQLGNVLNGADVVMPGTGRRGVSIAAGSIGTGSEVNVAALQSLMAGDVSGADLTAGTVGMLRVRSWTAGTIQADAIAMLTVAGDFAANVNPGAPAKARLVSLGSALIGGSITGGTWDIAGRVGSIVVRGNACAGGLVRPAPFAQPRPPRFLMILFDRAV